MTLNHLFTLAEVGRSLLASPSLDSTILLLSLHALCSLSFHCAINILLFFCSISLFSCISQHSFPFLLRPSPSLHYSSSESHPSRDFKGISPPHAAVIYPSRAGRRARCQGWAPSGEAQELRGNTTCYLVKSTGENT